MYFDYLWFAKTSQIPNMTLRKILIGDPCTTWILYILFSV